MLPLPCVILSGGKSSRMGEDKSLLPFLENKSLIQYQYERLQKVFQKVYISSKTQKFNFNANIILDNGSIYSPMIALESILSHFENQKVFIITVDTPFVSTHTIQTLVEQSNDHEITIAQSRDTLHNLCGVFDSSILKKIQSFIQQDIHKINALVNKSHTKIVSFENEKEFLNINTPDIYNQSLEYYKNI